MGWAQVTAAWLAVALGAAPGPAGDAFVDPLDVPAQATALAPRSPLTAVAALAARVVAVGPRGHVLWSEDGGAHWAQADVPVSTDLTAVRLVPGGRGWAVGHDGVVLATADGGRTWARQLDLRSFPAPQGEVRGAAPDALGAALLDVWFDDERTGFAVGAFGLALRTDDGGRRWARWSGGGGDQGGMHRYAVRRAGGALLVAGEQGLLLRVEPERPRALAPSAPAGGSLFGLTGGGRTVVAFGLAGRAIRSGDGGATWQPVRTGVEESLTAGTSLPDGRLVLVTEAGQVLLSADDGRSFRKVALGTPGGAGSPPRREPVAGVAAVGPGALVLVGPGGARRVALRQEE